MPMSLVFSSYILVWPREGMKVLSLSTLYFLFVLVEPFPWALFGHLLLSKCVALQDLHGLL